MCCATVTCFLGVPPHVIRRKMGSSVVYYGWGPGLRNMYRAALQEVLALRAGSRLTGYLWIMHWIQWTSQLYSHTVLWFPLWSSLRAHELDSLCVELNWKMHSRSSPVASWQSVCESRTQLVWCRKKHAIWAGRMSGPHQLFHFTEPLLLVCIACWHRCSLTGLRDFGIL